MTHRHQLVVEGPHPSVVADLANGPVELEPILPGKGLVRFADGDGVVHAKGDHTLVSLMDDDHGAILHAVTNHLRGHGYAVDHHDLGPD